MAESTPTVYRLTSPPVLTTAVTLGGSKSIHNRALVILALSGTPDPDLWLKGGATASDTLVLRRLLWNSQAQNEWNAGDAGTAFRFLTAYLTLQPGEQVLTGSARMLERPVGPLVTALRELGADIDYLGREGYPPLRIGERKKVLGKSVVLKADVSSQFVTALLLIGPCLPEGLSLTLEGTVVSKPYIHMTLEVMRHFGAEVEWTDERSVRIMPGLYRPAPLQVEADWSAAAFWYALAALGPVESIRLNGLFSQSWQGDARVAAIFKGLGVETSVDTLTNSIVLTRSVALPKPLLEHNFTDTPDLVQPVAVACAGLGVHGLFSGIETLKIKETDRIVALRKMLALTGVALRFVPPPPYPQYALEGKSRWEAVPRFATFGDHRMAMAFAALCRLGPVEIENPEVAGKSYPDFWQHLTAAGITVETL